MSSQLISTDDDNQLEHSSNTRDALLWPEEEEDMVSAPEIEMAPSRDSIKTGPHIVYGSDGDNEDQEQDAFQGAIPMDSLRNGARTAYDLWQWGFAKVKEQAQSTAEWTKSNENVQTMIEKATPAVTTVKSYASSSYESICSGSSALYESAKPKIEGIRARAEPTMSSLSHSASEKWESTKSTVGNLSSACRPALERTSSSTQNFVKRMRGEPTESGTGDGKPIVSSATSPFDDM